VTGVKFGSFLVKTVAVRDHFKIKLQVHVDALGAETPTFKKLDISSPGLKIDLTEFEIARLLGLTSQSPDATKRL
jgi:hypothetical protein